MGEGTLPGHFCLRQPINGTMLCIMRNLAATVILVAGTIVLLAACSPSLREEEFHIGIVVPLSGNLASFGPLSLQAAHLAVDEANDAGGILKGKRHYHIVLVEKDGRSTPEMSLAAAQELITRDRVAAIVSPGIAAAALPASGLAERSGVPIILRIPTGPEVTRGARYKFRVTFDDESQGASIARFLVQKLAVRRVAILYDSTNLGNSAVVDAFQKHFTAAGGRLTSVQSYAYRQTDFRKQLLLIKESAPECLFLPNYSYDVLLQVEQARALGMSASIFCSDIMSFASDSDLAKLEGAWMCAHFDPGGSTQKAQHFIAAYRRKYGRPPNVSAALTFDACSLLIDAARVSGDMTPEEISAALRTPHIFEGVTGSLKYRGGPDPEVDVLIMRIVQGVPTIQQGAAP
jgi:branched-chain amino acid transport system substrate-binding protein